MKKSTRNFTLGSINMYGKGWPRPLPNTKKKGKKKKLKAFRNHDNARFFIFI